MKYMIICVGEKYPSVDFLTKEELEVRLNDADWGLTKNLRTRVPEGLGDFNDWPDGTYIFQVEGPIAPQAVETVTCYKLP